LFSSKVEAKFHTVEFAMSDDPLSRIARGEDATSNVSLGDSGEFESADLGPGVGDAGGGAHAASTNPFAQAMDG
jgi:hypothetical protein